MSKQNGFFCDNPEHGHISEMDAVECHGRGKIEQLEATIRYHVFLFDTHQELNDKARKDNEN